MKRIIAILILLAAASVSSFACKAPAKEPVPDGTLRILAIGNSFTEDGTEYLPDILEDLGVRNVEIVRMLIGGCTLERHVHEYEAEASAYLVDKSEAGGNKWVREQNASLQDVLSRAEYDIITIQQASPVSGVWESYQPWLDKFAGSLRQSQPKALLGWQMTWSYSAGFMADGRYTAYGTDPGQMFRCICSTMDSMMSETDWFTYVIPSAVAVDNARKAGLCSAPLELTRDGFHIDLGAGRYILAMTWYQSLVRPFTGISVEKNSFNTENGNIKVNDVTRPACIKAAVDAVRKYKKVIRKNSK